MRWRGAHRGVGNLVLVLLLVPLVAGCTRERATAPPLAASHEPVTELPRSAAEPRERFVQALALAARGEDNAARGAFLDLLDTYPALADYHLAHLAAIEERAGRLADAEALAERLLTDHPASVWGPAAWARRARLAAVRGEVEAAAVFAARVLAAPGTDAATRAEAMLVRADLRAADRPREAYVLYQEVRRMAGEPAARARAQCTRLDTRHPELLADAALLVDEGELLLHEGRLEEAAHRLERAAAIASPALRAPALRVMARVQRRQGRLDEAVATYRTAIAVEPPASGQALYELATLLWNRDRDGEAGVLYARLLREAPRHPRRATARYALGRIAEQAGREAEARAHYRRLAASGPEGELAREARWRLAWLHHRTGPPEAAIAAFARLARSGGGDRTAAGYWEARLRERHQGAAVAAPLYRAVLTRDPESYYADLCERRLGASAPPPALPTPLDGEPPPELTAHAYHWERSQELHALGLDHDAIRELDALARARAAASAPEPFLMEAYSRLGAHVRALRLAARLGRRDAVPASVRAAYLYPRAYWQVVSEEAAAHRIDPYLVLALARQESLFDPEAVSPAAAHGLMQLLVSTATRVAGAPITAAELYDPATNVRLGTRYLRQLLDRYAQDLPKALAAYNGGEEAMAKWEARAPGVESDEFVETISFRETRAYVKTVLGNYRRYRRLYGGPGEWRALLVAERESARAYGVVSGYTR